MDIIAEAQQQKLYAKFSYVKLKIRVKVWKINHRNLLFKGKTNIYWYIVENESLVIANKYLLVLFCDKHWKNTYTKISYMQIVCTILAALTCFFFCASLLSTVEVETSKDFCAAFKAAGLYTVFVRPVDVDNTYQYKFNFLKIHQRFMIS